MNIREITGSPEYWKINREERNYAAILFAALCKPSNAKVFLEHCGYTEEIVADFCVYFEYSHLRDIWKDVGAAMSVEEANKKKKEIIRAMLQGISGLDEILAQPKPHDINKSFGVGGKMSEKHIQYPGKWSVARLHDEFERNEDFEKLCKFKWAFNIKPDLVIHLNKDRAICIETKYESVEGSYPASQVEKDIFKEKRKLNYVRQIDLQEYLLTTLLGIKTDFICISSAKNSDKTRTHKSMGWKEIFDSLCICDFHTSIQDMARNPKLDAASATV